MREGARLEQQGAQLEMQDDPRKALTTLESVDLSTQLAPVADQVRCMRATSGCMASRMRP